jgi:membrane-associated phospholipid phosphatase
LNALDRPYAGRYDGGFSLAGEALIASVYTAVLLLDLFDVHKSDEPFDSFLVDFAVLAETLLLNGAVNQLVKMSVARPRPLLYGRDPDDQLLRAPERYLSFYSAHTSSAFSVGLAYAQTFAYRHPDSPYRFLVYAGAVLMGGIIGATRIAAGQHFPTDVLAGAVAGTTFGLLIPWLHRRSSHAQVSMTATPQSFGVALAIDSL